MDFLLDNWLAVRRETVPQTEDAKEVSSLSISHLYYGSFNPYCVVPVFENSDERKNFVTFLASEKEDFFSEVGGFDPSNSDYAKTTALAFDPDYISYLCLTGKTIVEWLNDWRKAQ